MCNVTKQVWFLRSRPYIQTRKHDIKLYETDLGKSKIRKLSVRTAELNKCKKKRQHI